jgi:hypothetical protein
VLLWRGFDGAGAPLPGNPAEWLAGGPGRCGRLDDDGLNNGLHDGGLGGLFDLFRLFLFFRLMDSSMAFRSFPSSLGFSFDLKLFVNQIKDGLWCKG